MRFLAGNLLLVLQAVYVLSRTVHFQLEGGQMGQEYTPGERFLSGKLGINSGMTTQIKDLGISWSAVEERIEAGQRVQAVEGSLTVGTDRTGQENRYQISGTLVPYGQESHIDNTWS